MQDKRIQIDEKFTDRGWSEMGILLDREMPVPPGRRRAFPWWWGAVLVGIVMLAGAGFLFFGKKQAATNAVSSQPVAGVKAMQPLGQQSLSTPSVLRTDDGTTAKENANSNLANQKESLSTTKGKPAAGQKLLPQNQAQILVEEEGQRNAFYSEEKKVAASSGLPNDTAVALLPASILPQKTIAPALLEAVDIETILLDDSPAPTVSAKILDPFSPRWGFAMEGAGMAALTKPGLGASISAIAVRPLKNSKVSIETGFGYAFLQQPLSVVVDGASAPVFEGSGSLVNANYGLQDELEVGDVNTGVVTSYLQALKLHYAQVPLRLGYQVHPRIGLMMGLEAGVLLSSDSKFTTGGVLSLSKQNSDISASGGGGKISTSVLDFAALGGLNFRLSQGFSVRLGCKFGLKDVLPDNSFGDYNRMFLAGIRYDFRCKN